MGVIHTMPDQIEELRAQAEIVGGWARNHWRFGLTPIFGRKWDQTVRYRTDANVECR
jgi:hypothetical protein